MLVGRWWTTLFFTLSDIPCAAYRLETHLDDSRCQLGNRPMRDLMFMLFPVALVIYFVIYPDQFSAFVDWAGQLFH